MKTQRRAVDGCRLSGEYAAPHRGIAQMCVALMVSLLAACLQSLSRTASRRNGHAKRAAFELLPSLPDHAGIATTSLLPTGNCQKLSRYASQDVSASAPTSPYCAWTRHIEPEAIFRSTRQGVRAVWIPENSPPPVRESPRSSAQPVVLAACPRTERQHGQGDLYFQHAA